LKDFFTDFNAGSQDIVEQLGQEAALKGVEKDSKSMFFQFWDRFKVVIRLYQENPPKGAIEA
jgi:hypothetical protein